MSPMSYSWFLKEKGKLKNTFRYLVHRALPCKPGPYLNVTWWNLTSLPALQKLFIHAFAKKYIKIPTLNYDYIRLLSPVSGPNTTEERQPFGNTQIYSDPGNHPSLIHTASKNPSPTTDNGKKVSFLTKQLSSVSFPFVLPVLKYYFHINKYFQALRTA